jgi:hypothetical protein
MCGNYLREETIQGRKLYEEIRHSTVLGAAIKYKPYIEITVEIGTYLKTVKITLNIFAV